MATRSPPVLIPPANTIAPQGEITRAAAQGPTVAAAGITDAPPGTHVRAAVVDAIGQAAATGAAVAQPDGPPPAVMSPAEGTPIGSAIAQDASANGENSHREKASGQHPDTAVERVAAKLKPEAEELRRDLPPVPAFAPHAQSAAAATSPIASIAVANAVGAIVSPLNVAAAAAAPHPETPEAGVPITGLAVEIAARALEGKRRFEIRLDPPELGRIDVRLDVGRDGQVTSRLVVERAETLDLLRRDAATLERALQSAGLRTDDAGLQFSLRDQSAGRWAGVEATPRSHLLIVPDADVAVHEAVRRGYGVLRGLGRGVDISV
jgi:flagellar hook-length control protein FliK